MKKYLKTLAGYIAPMFFHVSIETLTTDDRYQAQRDLLTAEHNAEGWVAQAAMLRGRIARLDAQISALSGAKQVCIDEHISGPFVI